MKKHLTVLFLAFLPMLASAWGFQRLSPPSAQFGSSDDDSKKKSKTEISAGFALTISDDTWTGAFARIGRISPSGFYYFLDGGIGFENDLGEYHGIAGLGFAPVNSSVFSLRICAATGFAGIGEEYHEEGYGYSWSGTDFNEGVFLGADVSANVFLSENAGLFLDFLFGTVDFDELAFMPRFGATFRF